MEEKIYSVDELSQILDLHPKTVRRFIREGKIKARKLGREWKVLESDFREYAHGELRTPDVPASMPAYVGAKSPDRIRVSAVVEFRERESEEASRISNSLIAMLNAKDPAWGPARFDLIYHPEEGKARFVLYGTPAFIAAIMGFFETVAAQEEDR